MGHKLAVELSGFCMQKLLSPPHSSRVVLWEKRADHTLFLTPFLHGCMSWEGFVPPMVPHSQVPRKINHSLFL